MSLSPDDEDTLTPIQVLNGRPVVATSWAAKSSVGNRRTHNEDAWGSVDDRVFAVADGVGGTAGGSRASTLAIAGLMSADSSTGWVTTLAELSRSVRRQCDAEGLPEAASTLVALVVEDDRCVLLSVGDSRIYRLRQGELRQLTTDHNMGTLSAETGDFCTPQLSAREARALTSYIGSIDPAQRMDVGTAATVHGDRYLLCSDGVHGQLLTEQLQAGMARADCAQAATWLVEQSDRAGGRDNATAMVVDFGRLA